MRRDIKEILDSNELKGKTVAMTGSTGGLGNHLCRYIIGLGARLIMLDRNRDKADKLEKEIRASYPNAQIEKITVDLEDMESVRAATNNLYFIAPDIFIHNAGAYSIPRKNCSTGFNNVFQINFVSPYYIIKKLFESNQNIKIVAVGSIAHTYSHIDTADVDFSTRTAASKLYGNAKRFLMFSLQEEFKDTNNLSIVHPGITFTNITAHYPKVIFAIIKYPMKVIFMPPKRAALSILYGVFHSTPKGTWIGPWIFNVWGLPKLQKLNTCNKSETQKIYEIAEEIYKEL